MLKSKRLLTHSFRLFSEASEYQKRMFQFEENWTAVVDEKNKEFMKNLEEILTPDQKNYVTALARAFCDLTVYEHQYFHSETVRHLSDVKAVPFLSLMTDWPSVKKNADGKYPVAEASWFLQQEKLAEMWPGGLQEFAKLFSNMGTGGGGASGGSESAAAPAKEDAQAAKAEKAKEEKPKEKTSFEIELATVDAAQKIKAIKEVRQILNLGLKDAKDLVEKAPVLLKKDVKKEEAEAIKEKLTAAGCTINLK